MTPQALYLDLLKRCLTRTAFPESYRPLDLAARRVNEPRRRHLYPWLQRWLGQRGVLLMERTPSPAPGVREEGRDWPLEAETMIGLKRLDSLQACCEDVIQRGVPGDLIETGVWRGGGSIFMRAVLAAYGDTRRTVWVADSFQGLPRPDPRYPADAADQWWTFAELAVPLETVQANFARYGLLDEQVRFLPGFFKDTLATAPITTQLAILRLDGDMYESTMDALTALYPKLAPGGYCIVDDYFAIAACREAVEAYRAAQGIREPIVQIDWAGGFWQRADG
jgi:O-methyltransferase